MSKANPDRIVQARLAADMSRADLAYAIRRITRNEIKASDRNIGRWENGEHSPRDGVIVAIATATGKPIEFFYGGGEASEDEEAAAMPIQRDIEEALRPLARLLAKTSAPVVGVGAR